MSGLLEGRVAIVTGGARGIGLAIAQTMVMQGARVLVADNGAAIDGSPEDSVVAESAVERLDALATGHAAAFAEDLAAPGAGERAVAAAIARFGAIDIVVNGASIRRDAPIHAADPAAFAHVIGNDLVAPFALLAAAAPRLREQAAGGRLPGAIVNLVSTAAFYGAAGRAAHAAAKAGLFGMTRSVALDFAGTGVRCNAIAPFAATRTSRLVAGVAPAGTEAPDPDAETRARRRAEQALRVPASYVANLACWLASPAAARVNGQLFGVRGRETFLFSQPRPMATVYTDPGGLDADLLGHTIGSTLEPHFADLVGDDDAFDIEPVV